MDSELDRTYSPHERNEEFERFLDEWLAQEPEKETNENRMHDSKDQRVL